MERDTRVLQQHLKDAHNIRMQQCFRILQRDWNDYKSLTQPKTYPPRYLKYSSAGVAAFQPRLDNSPRNLMSSLQRPGTFSSSSTWKVRNNELAVQEIRRERKAAIESGKLKGRRLSYDDIDVGLGVQENVFTGNYGDGFVQERDQVIRSIPSSDSDEEYGEKSTSKGKEVPVCLHCLSYSSASSSSSAASSLSGIKNMVEKMAVKEEEKVMPTLGEKMRRVDQNGSKIGKREIAKVWIAITSVIIVIFSLRSLGFGAYNEEGPRNHLVPT